MSPARVRKQIVCPECGRPVRVVPASAAKIQAENLPDEDVLAEVVAEPGSLSAVEVIIEEGPVCPRCAGH